MLNVISADFKISSFKKRIRLYLENDRDLFPLHPPPPPPLLLDLVFFYYIQESNNTHNPSAPRPLSAADHVFIKSLV